MLPDVCRDVTTDHDNPKHKKVNPRTPGLHSNPRILEKMPKEDVPVVRVITTNLLAGTMPGSLELVNRVIHGTSLAERQKKRRGCDSLATGEEATPLEAPLACQAAVQHVGVQNLMTRYGRLMQRCCYGQGLGMLAVNG